MADTERFRDLDRLFQAVCDLPPEERPRRLIELAPGDVSLRSEVLALLEADARARSTESLSPDAVHREISRAIASGQEDPEELAGYRVLSRLGTGGMGVVYEARQRSPQRLVALKVLRPGFATPDLIRRFEFEAEALARLRHPGIAQIYEAGVAETPAGPRPFFAMELVRGRPLDGWAAGKGVRERLEMVATVCEAVQHAHAQGVLHRDLKPANILVTDEGLPKVLDFGVARAADAELRSDTLETLEGQIVGTLPYMSPELLAGEPSEIDTRSDVYALGVVLYELLSGRTPHEVGGKGLVEAAGIIRESEPTRLSLLEPKLRGDIETIVRTAISKDKSRRYQTAQAMGDDIRRYLDGQTIAARPASAVYQLSRLARRHKPVAIASGVALLALVGAVVGVSLSLDEAVEQRKAAERHAKIADAVSAFFNDEVLAAADPWTDPDPDRSVVEALEMAVEKVGGRFEDEPLVEAAIRASAGRTLNNLGRYDNAQAELRRAIDLLKSSPQAEPVRLAETQATLGMVLGEAGLYDDSLALLEEAHSIFQRELGPDAFETQDHACSLVLTLIDLAEFDRARALNDELLQRVDSSRIASEGLAINVLGNAGAIEYKTGNIEGAVPYYERMVERSTAHYGRSHPDTNSGVGSLGLIYQRLGRLDESLAQHERAVAASTEALGLDHPYTLTARNNMALLLSEKGENDRARTEFEEILRVRTATLGETHPDTLVSMLTTARHLSKMGAFDEAETLGLRGMALFEQELGADHPYTMIGRRIMGTIYENAGMTEESERWRALSEEPNKAPNAR